MATADRVLAVLGLFSIDRPEWTVEAISEALNLSGSTAYQYVRSLVVAGLLTGIRGGRYTVGPAVIELDRLTRRFEPLVNAAHDMMHRLADEHPGESVALLCRLYRLGVMCVDQYAPRAPNLAISYERGRPMPLLRGAASKVILANLPSRTLKRFFDRNATDIGAAGLSTSWGAFKRDVHMWRRAGALATHGELDPGMIGVSSALFDADNVVVGSIGLVIPASSLPDSLDGLETVLHAVRTSGEQVTKVLRS